MKIVETAQAIAHLLNVQADRHAGNKIALITIDLDRETFHEAERELWEYSKGDPSLFKPNNDGIDFMMHNIKFRIRKPYNHREAIRPRNNFY